MNDTGRSLTNMTRAIWVTKLVASGLATERQHSRMGSILDISKNETWPVSQRRGKHNLAQQKTYKIQRTAVLIIL